MEIGMVGLGKMGMALTENMRRNGIHVVGYDLNLPQEKDSILEPLKLANTLPDLVDKLPSPRIIWLMLPAGKITDTTITELRDLLDADDIVIDGGNSFYQDSIKHNELLKSAKIKFFDVGTSGGIDGARYDGNFMIGGDDEQTFHKIEDLFIKISASKGYLYTGKAGSGHYLKMVHNGIEYGMMEAIAEGFDVLEHSPYKYDNESVAQVWSNGSVIRGWLMELAESAFSKDNDLEEIKGVMHSSGEGKWTLDEAMKLQVPVPVIGMSLMMRYRSAENDTFTGKVVAALRNEFGGHGFDKQTK